MKKPEQLDMLTTPEERARPWRIAAETAEHDPNFPQAERAKRADYFRQQAARIERGEA